jgi:hypothetical protein
VEGSIKRLRRSAHSLHNEPLRIRQIERDGPRLGRLSLFLSYIRVLNPIRNDNEHKKRIAMVSRYKGEIPIEAVQAVAAQFSFLLQDPVGDYTNEARIVLDAAAPYLIARALEETTTAFEDEENDLLDQKTKFKVGNWLLDRADVIKEV